MIVTNHFVSWLIYTAMIVSDLTFPMPLIKPCSSSIKGKWPYHCASVFHKSACQIQPFYKYDWIMWTCPWLVFIYFRWKFRCDGEKGRSKESMCYGTKTAKKVLSHCSQSCCHVFSVQQNGQCPEDKAFPRSKKEISDLALTGWKYKS